MRQPRDPSPSSPTSPGGRNDLRIDYVDVLAKQLLVSHAHTMACATMIVAGLIEVIWILLPHGGVGQLPDHPVFVAVETYVTLGLLLDIALRVALKRGAFCNEWPNVVDSFVALVSVLSSALSAAGRLDPSEMLIAEAIVTARIAFRLLRLLTITRGFQRQHAAAYQALDKSQEIDFDREDLGDLEAPDSPNGLPDYSWQPLTPAHAPALTLGAPPV